jgi:ribosomal 50S subunit-recycling heat shock protein
LRLDVFLKRTGLVKQRTLAREACDGGLVRVGGRVAKAGKEVAPGQRIALETAHEFLDIEIVGLPDRNYRRREGEVFYRIREERHKEVL